MQSPIAVTYLLDAVEDEVGDDGRRGVSKEQDEQERRKRKPEDLFLAGLVDERGLLVAWR